MSAVPEWLAVAAGLFLIGVLAFSPAFATWLIYVGFTVACFSTGAGVLWIFATMIFLLRNFRS